MFRFKTFTTGARFLPSFLNQWQDDYSQLFSKGILVIKRAGAISAASSSGTYPLVPSAIEAGALALIGSTAATIRRSFYLDPTYFSAGTRTNNFYLFNTLTCDTLPAGTFNVSVNIPAITFPTNVSPYISAAGTQVTSSLGAGSFSSPNSVINFTSGPFSITSATTYAIELTVSSISGVTNVNIESQLFLMRN